jgi:hypothetical protein
MRIYKPKDGSALFSNIHAHWLPFDLERSQWTIVDAVSDAEIIPIMQHKPAHDIKHELGHLRDDQLLIMMMVFHMMDNQDSFEDCEAKANLFRDCAKNVAVVHTNAYNNHPDHVYYDMMLNRQKAYYIDYDQHDLRDRIWSINAGPETYNLSGLNKHRDAKHFLCLNRIYYEIQQEPRMRYRSLLAQYLSNRNGWISDPQKGVIIEPEAMTTNMRYHMLSGATTWWPAARYYYENSYLSIYVETLTTSTQASTITEKTYDAFMNGHFILPFGYRGLVEDIRDRGFILPEWIDYGYDSIANDDDRFDAFMNQVHKALSLTIDELNQHWLRDIKMLEINRHRFWKLPYDKLHEKVKARYNLTCR